MEWMLILIVGGFHEYHIAPIPAQYPTESACNAARERFADDRFDLSKCIPVPKKDSGR